MPNRRQIKSIFQSPPLANAEKPPINVLGTRDKTSMYDCSEYDRVIDAAGQDDQHAPQKTCVVAAHRLDEPCLPTSGGKV